MSYIKGGKIIHKPCSIAYSLSNGSGNHVFVICTSGRKQCLSLLAEKKNASFIIIKGRRRIGKSRLIEEFGKGFERFLVMRGIAPKKDTNEQTNTA